eukprot:gene1821-2155_t
MSDVIEDSQMEQEGHMTEVIEAVTSILHVVTAMASKVDALQTDMGIIKSRLTTSALAAAPAAGLSSPRADAAAVKKVLDNPYQFEDFRDAKQRGESKPGHPDFKSIDGMTAVWLDNDIPSILREQLQSLPSDMPQGGRLARYKRKWSQLLLDPSSYEDLRAYKTADPNRAALPDFRKINSVDQAHAIWLDDSVPETAEYLEHLANAATAPEVLQPN